MIGRPALSQHAAEAALQCARAKPKNQRLNSGECSLNLAQSLAGSIDDKRSEFGTWSKPQGGSKLVHSSGTFLGQKTKGRQNLILHFLWKLKFGGICRTPSICLSPLENIFVKKQSSSDRFPLKPTGEIKHILYQMEDTEPQLLLRAHHPRAAGCSAAGGGFGAGGHGPGGAELRIEAVGAQHAGGRADAAWQRAKRLEGTVQGPKACTK